MMKFFLISSRATLNDTLMATNIGHPSRVIQKSVIYTPKRDDEHPLLPGPVPSRLLGEDNVSSRCTPSHLTGDTILWLQSNLSITARTSLQQSPRAQSCFGDGISSSTGTCSCPDCRAREAAYRADVQTDSPVVKSLLRGRKITFTRKAPAEMQTFYLASYIINAVKTKLQGGFLLKLSTIWTDVF